MTTKPALKVVANEAPPVEDVDAIHISDLIRADAMNVDWRRVHEAGDRRAPIFLPDKAGRGWR